MPKVNKSALVAYSTEQMFALVNNVAEYQQFLPGCRQSVVLQESENFMQARMVLAKAGIEQTLVTENTLTPTTNIHMKLSQGPFKSLEGVWTFTALSEQACKIQLDLEFEFANKMIDIAFGGIFKNLSSNMVQAFTERAKQVYK